MIYLTLYKNRKFVEIKLNLLAKDDWSKEKSIGCLMIGRSQ